MKKKIFTTLLVLVVAFIFTGCNNGNVKNNDNDAEWKINMNNESLNIPKDAKKAFNSATKTYSGVTLEPIALVGTQVVSGKNYMFLCKGTTTTNDPVSSFKMVTIYNNLKNEASIKEVRDFDINKYINQNIEGSNEQLSGGWTVYGETKSAKLEDNASKAFTNALNGYSGLEYSPIALVATSNKNGYAVLALGKSNTRDVYYSINVLTIKANNDNNAKLVSNAYVNLADFN